MDILYKLKRVAKPDIDTTKWKYVGCFEYKLLKRIKELDSPNRSYGNKYGYIYSDGVYYFIKGSNTGIDLLAVDRHIRQLPGTELPFYRLLASNYTGKRFGVIYDKSK